MRARVAPFVLAGLATLLGLSPLLLARAASADPYRLRADAVGYTQATQSPVGLLVLQGEDRATPWASAEALAWAGNRNGNADVLTALVRLHDPDNYGELRLGRQIITVGALRPLHVDGVDARLRSPTGTSLEGFGGLPVQPQFSYRAWDWATGARLAQSLGRFTSVGASYLQQRADGRVTFEEAGLDFASSPVPWFDLAAHGAYDLFDPGLAEVGLSLAGRFGDVRPELFATQRSPSHLVPATSLFSALGDVPSKTAGTAVKWKMFPRLDVLPTVAARSTDGDVGVDATLRVTLRLDDRGEGALTAEGRRQGSGPDLWSGLRVALRVPVAPRLRASTELEVVTPDDPRGRGAVWPWGLVALRWLPAPRWEIAAAVEAASTPTATREVNALARLGWTWDPARGSP